MVVVVYLRKSQETGEAPAEDGNGPQADGERGRRKRGHKDGKRSSLKENIKNKTKTKQNEKKNYRELGARWLIWKWPSRATSDICDGSSGLKAESSLAPHKPRNSLSTF